MITIIAPTKELEKIKSLIEDDVNILQIMEVGNISSMSVILDDVPFELSTAEEIQSLKRMICKNEEYIETDVAYKNKAAVIGSFGEDESFVFLKRK